MRRLFYMLHLLERATKSTLPMSLTHKSLFSVTSEHQIELSVTTQDTSRPKKFQDFTMKWSIQHVTSSPHFPHGNVHAEKAVHVVKQIYLKADDVKLALLLLKTMPISNNKKFIQEAPANIFYGRQWKAHLPVKRKPTVLQNFDDNATSEPEIPSKYNIGEEIWVKLDSNLKWMPGKIEQVLPNQSYTIKMVDRRIFRRNEHHITIR